MEEKKKEEEVYKPLSHFEIYKSEANPNKKIAKQKLCSNLNIYSVISQLIECAKLDDFSTNGDSAMGESPAYISYFPNL